MRKTHVLTLLLILVATCSCSLPGKTYYYMSTIHDLPAGSVIKESDIVAGKAQSFRILLNGYRLPPEPAEWGTEDRSRVVGHTVLKHIAPGHIIDLRCISQ